MFPKRDEVYEGIPVPLDNVAERVEFDPELDPLRHHRQIPENGGRPEPYLDQNRNQLPDVTGIYVQRRNTPADAAGENHHAEQIVQSLKIVHAERHIIAYDQDQEQSNKSEMPDHIRHDLDHNQNL